MSNKELDEICTSPSITSFAIAPPSIPRRKVDRPTVDPALRLFIEALADLIAADLMVESAP